MKISEAINVFKEAYDSHGDMDILIREFTHENVEYYFSTSILFSPDYFVISFNKNGKVNKDKRRKSNL